MSGFERLASQPGTTILGVGTHAVKLYGFASRDATTIITAAIINGVEYDKTALEEYWPQNTIFGVGELFLFAATDEVTSITVSGESGSISGLGYNMPNLSLPNDFFMSEDGLFYFITEDGLNYLQQETEA